MPWGFERLDQRTYDGFRNGGFNGQKVSIMIRRIEEYFLFFIIYSVIGWIYEVFLETVVYGWGFTNRGILWGPYCPVYGVGAVIFILTLNRLIAEKNKKQRLMLIPIIFMLCMIIATGIELVSTYILEYFIGSWPWQTYADYAVNFQARIALSPSIRFGIGGVIIIYIIQPLIERVVLGFRNINYIAAAILMIFIFDILFTLIMKY